MGYHRTTGGLRAFADTFVGGDRPFFIGNDWILICPQSNAVAGVDIAAQVNIGGSGLTYGSGSGINNNGMFVQAIPSRVSRDAVLRACASNGTFAEFQIVSRVAGIDAGIGPSVCNNPGDESHYFIQVESINFLTSLARRNANGTSTAINANCFNNVDGDIVRLEQRIVGGFPQLKVYQNGVLRSTDLDNSGLGPTSGLFGFTFSGVFTGKVTVKNFNGGILSPV
jgi:hypothetical protein